MFKNLPPRLKLKLRTALNPTANHAHVGVLDHEDI